jgi:hypothetical protein
LLLSLKPKLSALASHEFYQASSKQVKTFIAAEHLFPRNFDFRGFASMDREKQLAIARKGGESVPNEKAQFYAKSEIGGRGRTRVSIPVSAAFRAITRSHRRPAARADTPRTPGRKKPAIIETSFVKHTGPTAFALRRRGSSTS